ncbi:MAG: pyridoxine 5'-phosphate synthase [Planctomycetota bacterium]|nr:pyridoxine 5'-phosphate synthase [Planctomycetota bacterium]
MSNSLRTCLSVNVNKVALLRNTRHLGEPSVVRASLICLEAGADGITVHPRPDERHIRRADVFEIAELLNEWPNAEYNIEGNPFHNLMEFIRDVRPAQATFVPDSESQSTSDHGWNLLVDAVKLEPLIRECNDLGVRVSLFMDPEAEQMEIAKQLGAERIELYTETWASSFSTAARESTLMKFAAAARSARNAGLVINAGHDLNLVNLTPFLVGVPGVAEVSIGHAFIGDALEMGYRQTVRAYLNCILASCGQ